MIPPTDYTDCYTGSDFFPDTKIRFKFRVIEVENNFA